MSDTTPNPLTTLLGGEELTLTQLDGATETVRVRQLAVRQLPQMLGALEDEARLVELYCDKPPGWADTLARASHEALIAAGERINGDIFARWVERRRKNQERLPRQNPEEQAAVLSAVLKARPELADLLVASAASALPASAPKPAPRRA